MRIGQIKNGWKLRAIAHAQPTVSEENPREPVYSEERRRWVPLPTCQAGTGLLYVTVSGVVQTAKEKRC